MNFFSRNALGDRTGGSFRGNGYWLGQTGTTRRAVIGRINATVDLLGGLYSRNAELPLQYRVPGAIYANIAATGDGLAMKYVVPFNENPQSSYWDQPADQAMKTGEETFTRQAFEYEDRVVAQEKAHQAAVRAGEDFEPEGPQLPDDMSYVPGVESPKTSNLLPVYIGLGVVAVAAIVGAALMSPASETPAGEAQPLPREGAPAEDET